jgi:hypothetical protein
MTSTEHILEAGLEEYGIDTHFLAGAIDAISGCAQACTTCADLCLLEPEVAELRACIRLCLDTADIGRATSAVVARRGAAERAVLVEVLEACASAAEVCGAECDRHAHDHCRLCAELCRRCVSACRALANEATGSSQLATPVLDRPLHDEPDHAEPEHAEPEHAEKERA